jgi:hypothetical protein
MKTIFTYGKIDLDQEIIGRSKELKKLLSNFSSASNTVLLSPSGMGKTSLLMGALAKMGARDKKLKLCMLDLSSVKTEEDFYRIFSTRLFEIFSSKREEIAHMLSTHFGSFLSKITEEKDSFSVLFDWAELARTPDVLWNFAEKIAKEKKCKLVLCLDGIEKLVSLEHSELLWKHLAGLCRKSGSVACCLLGTDKPSVVRLFNEPSSPLYQIGAFFVLEKIPAKEWVAFVSGRFAKSGKQIARETAARIVALAEGHPEYVQQLAHQTWLRTARKCSDKIVEEAYEELVRQMDRYFRTLTDDLSPSQANYLKALLEEVEQPSARENLERYGLGTSANVIRIKQALQHKELLVQDAGSLYIADPLYKYWLRRYYWNSKN